MPLPRSIETPKDIAIFFTHLIEVEHVSFHPDESFESYGRTVDGQWVPAYDPQEAEIRDTLMEQAFVTAKSNGLDIYCIGLIASNYYYRDLGEQIEDCHEEKKLFLDPGYFEWSPE